MVRRRFIHAGLFALLLTQAAEAVLISSTWVGGPTGNWNVAGNWSPAGVPNNGADTFSVRIDNNTRQSANVTLNMFPAVISGLIIDAGDTLTQPTEADMRLQGNVTNNGTWQMNSVGNFTEMQLDAPTVTFGGSGQLLMSNNIQNRLFGINGNRTMVNGLNHTIRGSGQLGLNSGFFYDNHGLIDANQGNAITIDATDGVGNFNDGVLQASVNGTLVLLNHSLDNTGGDIQAIGDGVVSLQGVGITNGHFLTADNGHIEPNPNVPTLQDCVNDGLFFQPTEADVNLQGFFTNNGTWQMNSQGNFTEVRLNTPVVTLNGDGEVLMSNNAQNRWFGVNGLRTLNHGASHVIRGSGQMGLNTNFLYDNHGLIDANQPNAITIDATDGPGNFNDGLLQASANGTLALLNHSLDNTGGDIQAIGDGVVSLQGVGIVNGHFQTAGNGRIELTTNPPTLENTVNDGLIVQPTEADVNLQGSFTNNATWQMNSQGNFTEVRLNAPVVTLGGPGEILMSNNAQNRWFGINDVRRLVHLADHTISGAGQLGLNTNFFYTNHGLIEATQANAITIDATDGAGNNFNDGVLGAAGGGTLVLLNHSLDSAGGDIQATGNSVVSLQGLGLINGHFVTADSGRIELSTNPALLENTVNDGLLVQPTEADVNLRGTITNNGTWQMNSQGNFTEIRLDGDIVTLNGDGEVVMSNNIQNRWFGINAARRLVNGPSHTIRGAAQLGLSTNFGLTNQGSIISEGNNGINIDVTDSMDFTNQGLLRASTGDITLQFGPFENQGEVVIDVARTLTRNGNYVQTDGVTTVNGTLNVAAGGTTQLQGGGLKGNGQVNGGITNSGGSVAPGNSAGTLSVAGGYTQQINGAYSVEIGGLTTGTQHDRMNVTGTATLAGTLEVSLINGFVPIVGDSFVILTATNISGVFTCLEAAPLPNGVFRAIYSPTAVTLTVQLTPPPPADLNGDGTVGGVDLGILLNNWSLPATAPGCNGATCCPSDLNEDGFVNGIDLGILLVNWTS